MLTLVIATDAQARLQLGAQIWIEPGQTPAEIDDWFAQLEAHMPVARLFMMWTYLEKSPNQLDFSLYDAAFLAAEKHHVRIVTALTPNGPPLFHGGNDSQGRDMMPTRESEAAANVYLAKIAERYRSSPALDMWLLGTNPDTSRRRVHWPLRLFADGPARSSPQSPRCGAVASQPPPHAPNDL